MDSIELKESGMSEEIIFEIRREHTERAARAMLPWVQDGSMSLEALAEALRRFARSDVLEMLVKRDLEDVRVH